jgi:hypothetical protein
MFKSLVAVGVVGSLAVASLRSAHAGAEVDAEDPTLAPPGMTAPLAEPATLEPAREGTPPLDGTRVVGELLLGSLFAAGGAIGGAYAGYALETADGCHDEWCGIGGIILGGTIGMTFVAPVGVYLAGSHSGETGSLGATIGGSVVGTLCGIGALALAQNEAGGVLFFAGPVVGSIVGFNLSRRYERPRTRQARWLPTATANGDRAVVGVVGSF